MAKTVEIPKYILDSVTRHIEQLLQSTKPTPQSIKSAESLRLLKIDLAKLKKINQ